MINVNTNFTPFRMRMSRREPVQFFVELVNRGEKDEMLTLEVYLSKQLSFDRGGYRTEDVQKISKLLPGAGKQFYYEIWPKAGTMAVGQPVKVRVLEHYKDFNYITREYNKNLVLAVED